MLKMKKAHIVSVISKALPDDIIPVVGAAAIVVPLLDVGFTNDHDFKYIPCKCEDAMYFEVLGWSYERQAFLPVGFYETEEDAVLAAARHHNKVMKAHRAEGEINMNPVLTTPLEIVNPIESVTVPTCEVCGSMTRLYKSSKKANRFCSRRCYDKSDARRATRAKEFKKWIAKPENKKKRLDIAKRKYQSDPDHRAKVRAMNNERRRVKMLLAPKKERHCIDCGESVSHLGPQTKRCPSCKVTHLRKYTNDRYHANPDYYKEAMKKYVAKKKQEGVSQ